MVILLSIIFSLALWVIAWAVGVKGFDAMMVVLAIVLGACAWTIIRPFLPGYREDPEDPGAGGRWLAK